MNEKLREEAKKLLEDQKINLFIGYQQGSEPFRVAPCFLSQTGEVEKLIWNPLCINDLATYLAEINTFPVGIVAKGCDSRSIIELIQEHQLNREDVIILGVPCKGVIDLRKLEKHCNLRNFTGIGETDETFVIHTKKGDTSVKCDEIIFDKCKTCQYHNPIIYDVLLSEELTPNPAQIDEYQEINQLEVLPLAERAGFWQSQFGRCIRCFACRNICPVCFCTQCVIEMAEPRWVSKATHLPNNWLALLIWASHLIGRCTDCGECERVCPMKLPLRKLNKKLEKEIKELFNYIAGVNPEEIPPLATFKLEDES